MKKTQTKRKKSASNKKIKKELAPLTKSLKIIGTTILCLILILIITGSIIVTSLTVYVMKFMDSSKSIDLEDASLGFTTFVYEDGK